ncbi:hypothetical protein [Gordonia caeni]|uniref:hypothetical protein n=1 Tax=Gordonia caeni TaxID=1007097 RepID=UPI0031D2007F
MRLDPRTIDDDVRRVVDRIDPLITEFGTSGLPPAGLLAAQLDQHIDVFGPADELLFQAVRWGRLAEFSLATDRGPESWQASTHDRVRYESLEALLTLDRQFLLSRASNQVQYYALHAYDIAALWRGAPSLAELAREGSRLARNASLRKGTAVAAGFVGSYLESKADRRDKRLHDNYLLAKTRYLDRH